MSQPPYPYYRIFDFESFSIVNPTTQQPGVQIEGELDAIKRTLDSLMSRLAEIQRDDGYIRDSALDESTIIPYFYDKLFILFQPVFLGKAGGEMDDTAVIYWIQNSLSSFGSGNTDTISTAVKLDGVKVEGAQWYEAEAQYLQEWDNELNYWEGGIYKDVVTSEVKKGSIELTRVGIGMNADLPAGVTEIGKITLSTGGPISPVSGGIFPEAGVESVSPHIKITDLNNGSISISPYGIFWPDGTLQTTRGIPQNEMGQYVDSAVSSAISTLVGGAPTFLDTLSEIADAINNDADIASTLANSIATKLSIVDAASAYYPVTNPSGYITSSALSGLLTQTAANGLYYPLGNPSGYITTSSLSGYLTSATAATTYFQIPTGDTTQYIAGNGTLQSFPTLATANKLTAVAYNQTGSTLTKGTVVYISGAHGNLPTISKSQANAESTSAGTYGFVVADIANATSGTVVIAGVAENLNTSGYVDGNVLYLSPTVAGGWTTTKPVAPNHMVYLGVVTRSHPTQGTVQLRIANGFELDELHDVLITSKTNNNLLAYESSTGLWKNKSFATLGLLTSSTAASTYQTIVGMNLYYTIYEIQNDFVTKTGMSQITVLDGYDNKVTIDGANGFVAQNNSATYMTSLHWSGITFPDGSNQTTAATSGIPDAPSDGTPYVRKDGAWEILTGVGGGTSWGSIAGTISSQNDLQSELDAKFATTGGAITGSITIANGTTDTAMSAEFFGIELTSDTAQYSELEYNKLTVSQSGYNVTVEPSLLKVWDTNNNTGLSLSAGGSITFNDSTVQTTAAFPFNGGTVYSAISVTGSGGTVSIGDSIGLNLSGSSAGIVFSDSTVQYTAAIAPPNADVLTANAIAANINFISGGWGIWTGLNAPSISGLISWGVYNVSDGYIPFSYSSGSYFYLSGSITTSNDTVMVNGSNSSFFIA